MDSDESQELTCAQCGNPISHKYIKAGNRFFHPECFICARCNQVIDTAYKSDGGRFFHSDCYKELKRLVCDHCGQVLDEKWTVYQGKKYHPECFKNGVQPRCGICGMTIAGEYTEDAEGVYHMACYKARKLPRCSVCDWPIEEGKYIQDVWGNISHESHGGKPYSLCSSCSIIISEKTSKGGFEYKDGRMICGICRESAVFHTAEIEEQLRVVGALLTTAGFPPLPKGITINLIDLKTLLKKSGSYKKNTKGLTNSSVKSIGSIRLSSQHDIFILHGLPKTEFRGVLAHELLHVFLSDWETSLNEQKMEGFCNLGSRIIYQNDPSKHAQILLENLERDPDPVYGDGYRLMLKQVERIGWGNFLTEVKNR